MSSIGDSGRVSWSRLNLDLDLIRGSETGRVLSRFEESVSEFVWNAAALEGNTYTLPEVQTLLDEGASVSGKAY